MLSHIFAHEHPVPHLFLSLEMSRDELMLWSLAQSIGFNAAEVGTMDIGWLKKRLSGDNR